MLSSFAFTCPAGNSAGPPSDAAGWTLPVRCAASFEVVVLGDWVCEHRDPYIRNMIRFRRTVAGTDVTRWWDNAGMRSPSRAATRGGVAINREGGNVLVSTSTGLAAGTYCDVLGAGRSGAGCAGASVVVGTSARWRYRWRGTARW
ncbi:MAG: hypothetical protein IPG88_27525 [Gemmatimonadetes bacterium]|nr:hypothetical protein [Gemmatimonadota bacterium]